MSYRGSDTYPKEQFYAHGAGLGGYGGSSYIDAVIMRDRDANTSWADTAADGTLEERVYYCQNWRADVSAVLDSSGAMLEWVKYSAYGVPLAIPAGDTTGDGVVDSTDDANAVALDMYSFGNANYDVRADWDLDGTIDTTDEAYINGLIGTALGRGVLSRSDVASRKGYAGYEGSGGGIDGVWQVRRRAFLSNAGRWAQRDPDEYPDGPSHYGYCKSSPIRFSDPSGRSPQNDPGDDSGGRWVPLGRPVITYPTGNLRAFRTDGPRHTPVSGTSDYMMVTSGYISQDTTYDGDMIFNVLLSVGPNIQVPGFPFPLVVGPDTDTARPRVNYYCDEVGTVSYAEVAGTRWSRVGRSASGNTTTTLIEYYTRFKNSDRCVDTYSRCKTEWAPGWTAGNWTAAPGGYGFNFGAPSLPNQMLSVGPMSMATFTACCSKYYTNVEPTPPTNKVPGSGPISIP